MPRHYPSVVLRFHVKLSESNAKPSPLLFVPAVPNVVVMSSALTHRRVVGMRPRAPQVAFLGDARSEPSRHRARLTPLRCAAPRATRVVYHPYRERRFGHVYRAHRYENRVPDTAALLVVEPLCTDRWEATRTPAEPPRACRRRHDADQESRRSSRAKVLAAWKTVHYVCRAHKVAPRCLRRSCSRSPCTLRGGGGAVR